MHAILLTLAALGAGPGDKVILDPGAAGFPEAPAWMGGPAPVDAGGGHPRHRDMKRAQRAMRNMMPQTCYDPVFGCYRGSRFMNRYPAFHGTYYRRPYNYRTVFDYPWHADPHEPTSLFSYNVEQLENGEREPDRPRGRFGNRNGLQDRLSPPSPSDLPRLPAGRLDGARRREESLRSSRLPDSEARAPRRPQPRPTPPRSSVKRASGEQSSAAPRPPRSTLVDTFFPSKRPAGETSVRRTSSRRKKKSARPASIARLRR